VHPDGRRVPWLYIHPGSGGMLTLHNFGRAVGADQPIFGLQAFPDRDEVGDAMPTVPEASERCLADLRALQPEGPYIVTGHSIGGHVAYHIACRLQEEGEEILFLGLLDPAAPQTLRRAGRLVARGKELAGVGPEGRRRGLLQIGLAVARHEARSRFGRPAPGVEEAVDEADNRGWESSLIAEESSYRPLRFRGPATVFQTGKTARFTGAADLGWGRHVDGPLEIVRVPGEHISMLLDPHIHVLAREIATRIDALYPSRV
jgi:thioesterase domain-containing protein